MKKITLIILGIILTINSVKANTFSWMFLNGSEIGESNFVLPEDINLEDITSVSISSDYNKKGNVPNVVINDNILYTLDSKNRLIKFDLESKKVIATKELKGVSKKFIISGIALYDDYIYVTFDNGYVIAYSLLVDAMLWNININTPINSAPVVDEGKIYFIANNNIYALDSSTGNILWSIYNSQVGVSFRKLFIPAIYKGYLMAGLSSSDFLIVLKENGEVQWKKNVVGLNAIGRTELNPTLGDIKSLPLAFDDKVLVSSNNRVSLYSIADKNVIWQNIQYGTISNLLKVDSEVIFVDQFSNLVSLDIKNGNMIWNYSLLSNIADIKEKVYWNNPQLINKNIVISNSIGKVIIFSLQNRQVIKVNNIYKSKKERIYYSPVVYNNELIFISSFGNLYFVK